MSSEILRLLSGSSDEEKFAGLALLTKVKPLRPDGSDLAAKNLSRAMPSLVASIGEKFIRRLLLSCMKSKYQDKEDNNNNTNHVSTKSEGGIKYGSLGVGFLSVVASTLCENGSSVNGIKPSAYELLSKYLSSHADLLVKFLEPSTGCEVENDIHHDALVCLTVIAERCNGGQDCLGRLDAWSVALEYIEKEEDESDSLLIFLKQLHRPESKHLEKLVSSCAQPAKEVIHDMERLKLLSVWLLRVLDNWTPSSTSFGNSARVALIRGFCCTTRDDMRDAALSVMAILLKKIGGRWAVDIASDTNAQFLQLCVSCACGEARIILDEALATPHCNIERRSRAAQVLPIVVSIFCNAVVFLCESDEHKDWSEVPAEALLSIRHNLEGCYRTILEYMIEIRGEGDVVRSEDCIREVVSEDDDAQRRHHQFQVTLACAALPAVGLWASEDPETLETELVRALPSIVCVLQERESLKHDYPEPPFTKETVMVREIGDALPECECNGQFQPHMTTGAVNKDDDPKKEEKGAPLEELACLFRATWSLSASSLETVMRSNFRALLFQYLEHFRSMHFSDAVPLQQLPPCEPTAYACSLLVDLNLVGLTTTTTPASLPPRHDNNEADYFKNEEGDIAKFRKQSIAFAFELAEIVTRRKPVGWSEVVAACVHLSLVCSQGLTEKYCSSLPWSSLETVMMEALGVERFEFCELEAYAWSQSASIASGQGDVVNVLLKPQTRGLCVILEEQWRPPTSLQ